MDELRYKGPEYSPGSWNNRLFNRDLNVVHLMTTFLLTKEMGRHHRQWTLDHCKYQDYLKTVNVDNVANWDERDRYQNMLVLRYKDGKNPGKMSKTR